MDLLSIVFTVSPTLELEREGDKDEFTEKLSISKGNRDGDRGQGCDPSDAADMSCTSLTIQI